MKIIIAIDSFKGCLTSMEANEAAAEGIRRAYPDAEIVKVPVSDGGEGYMEAFHAAIGGQLEEVTVRDPLMRPIVAKYLLHNDLAVIEIAQASGLTLLTQEECNPMVATSYGTGQLVADAIRKGAKHIIVGLGGSATSDAGIGCGACVAACKNGSAMLFVSSKVSQLALLPQGRVEAARRAKAMMLAMEEAGFGNCTNTRACEAVCPKNETIANIARLNREFIKAKLAD